MNSSPLVSICCAAFNHEVYIKETLDGFLMQEVDFEYEILIHDDASTDNTATIIKEYEEKYPNVIFPIYQTQNQYSQGKKYSDLNYERVRGKYVALCEGDDCWTDKTKLAKQVKAFEKNPQCGICFHPALSQNCLTNKEVVIGKYANKDCIIDINDVIMKKYEMIPTASLLVTKEVLQHVLEYKSTRKYLTVGDLYFQIFGSLNGGALYIDEVMSVYRHFTPQSWSIAQSKSLSNQLRHLIAMAKSYQELDTMTDYQYTKAFQLSTLKRLFSVTGYESFEDMPKEFDLYAQLFKNLLAKLEENSYVLYGAGSTARLILSEIPEKINFVIDKDERKHNTKFLTTTIKALNKIEFNENQKIIISLIARSESVVNELINDYGIKKDQIITFEEVLFEADLLKELVFD